MQRSRVEGYYYNIVRRTPDGNFETVDLVRKNRKVRSERERKAIVSEYGDESLSLVLVDTDVVTYVMDDDFFFAHAVVAEEPNKMVAEQ